MTVEELIKKLKQCDPNAQVICRSEDEQVQAEGHSVRLFELDSVSQIDAVRDRGDDNVVFLKPEGTGCTERLVCIDLNGDI